MKSVLNDENMFFFLMPCTKKKRSKVNWIISTAIGRTASGKIPEIPQIYQVVFGKIFGARTRALTLQNYSHFELKQRIFAHIAISLSANFEG